jgi:hypothetical protein
VARLEVSELPDDPIQAQAEKEKNLRPIEDMIEEIKRKQQAPVTRSKWNVAKEEIKKDLVIDLLEDTTKTDER